jgi:hypothetical protein
MSWFAKAIKGNVSLMHGTKHLSEGQVFPFTEDERNHVDSLLFEKLEFIKFFKTVKEAEDYKFIPMSKLEPMYRREEFEVSVAPVKETTTKSVETTNTTESKTNDQEIGKKNDQEVEEKDDQETEEEESDPISKTSSTKAPAKIKK